MSVHIEYNFKLQSGITMPEVRIAYTIFGKLAPARDNLVVFPTYFTGRQQSNMPYFGAGRAIDPARHCILVPGLVGNGESSSPGNTIGQFAGADFPLFTMNDNVRLQRKLVDQVCPVDRLALVIGWSMGGCQAMEWAAQFPDFVERALPICATARCGPHNRVFLEGVKAALKADCKWAEGRYSAAPETGLRAFGRAYAGWAYSTRYFADELYRQNGFDSIEELLDSWESDHLEWDANDLLCKLATWQSADISANDRYAGDIERALKSISARMIVMPTTTDMYFDCDQAEAETALIPNGEFRPYQTRWGHCAATPSSPEPGFMGFMDTAIGDLLSR